MWSSGGQKFSLSRRTARISSRLHLVQEQQTEAHSGKPITIHFAQGLVINPFVRSEFEGKTFADTQAVLNRYAELFAQSETTKCRSETARMGKRFCQSGWSARRAG